MKTQDIKVGTRFRKTTEGKRVSDGSIDREEFWAKVTRIEGPLAYWERLETISQSRPDILASTMGGGFRLDVSALTMKQMGYRF